MLNDAVQASRGAVSTGEKTKRTVAGVGGLGEGGTFLSGAVLCLLPQV